MLEDLIPTVRPDMKIIHEAPSKAHKSNKSPWSHLNVEYHEIANSENVNVRLKHLNSNVKVE